VRSVSIAKRISFQRLHMSVDGAPHLIVSASARIFVSNDAGQTLCGSDKDGLEGSRRFGC